MSQDSEKRFHSIMEKLFQNAQGTPSSNSASSSSSSSVPGVQLSRGIKRPYSSSTLVVAELRSKSDVIEALQRHSSSSAGSSDAPLCRPWDRGDLSKRLTTFKSMTWFGKPKVVNATNCARRGWINVDMDTIACESCGARLLFSAPSSWNQQQVEKAALVFSLKLDNGHKLLCPWIDNACDEALANFPPTPPPILVNKFRERCSMLLHLSALPVISSSFLKWMKSPHLKQFLEELSLKEFGNESLNKSEIEFLGDGDDSDTAKVYYQALKLISLFGWEPRSLPYVVDCKAGSDQSLKKSTNLYTAATKENVGGNRIAEISNELQSLPNSVVLDCRVCGASVGLWTFHTTPKPVEIIRLGGPTELNSESGTRDSGNKNFINHAGISYVGISKLTTTIAGGPTPAQQSFKATVTLPVIGKNLRARLCNDENFSDRMYTDQEMVQADSLDKSMLQDSNNEDSTLSGQIDQPEDISLFQNQTLDRGCGTTGDDQTPLLEGTSVTDQGTLPESSLNGSTEETPVKRTEIVPAQEMEVLENAENSIQLDSGNIAVDLHPGPFLVKKRTEIVPAQEMEVLEDAENSMQLDSGNKAVDLHADPSLVEKRTEIVPAQEIEVLEDAENSIQLDSGNKAADLHPGPPLVENPSTSTDAVMITSSEKELPFVVSDQCDSQQVSENDTSNSKEVSLANLPATPNKSSSLEVNTSTDITSKNESTKDKLGSDNHTTSENQDREGVDANDKVYTAVNSEHIVHGGDDYLKGALLGANIMEFDPTWQHRHFCNWIATGNVAPGWKQTLTALQREKSSSPHSPKNSPSASFIKVDDPVTSVRNLFTSSAKKLKSSLSNENTKH